MHEITDVIGMADGEGRRLRADDPVELGQIEIVEAQVRGLDRLEARFIALGQRELGM